MIVLMVVAVRVGEDEGRGVGDGRRGGCGFSLFGDGKRRIQTIEWRWMSALGNASTGSIIAGYVIGIHNAAIFWNCCDFCTFTAVCRCHD